MRGMGNESDMSDETQAPDDDEAWLRPPEMRAKLERADAWMREHPPAETDLEELERRLLSGL
ncbi:MAG TPA: hypothetical protein VFA39_20070 [Steroidobacteraceae bacterium]|nr:hypothetical protein [Steroidobacteraceae bacterium]